MIESISFKREIEIDSNQFLVELARGGTVTLFSFPLLNALELVFLTFRCQNEFITHENCPGCKDKN